MPTYSYQCSMCKKKFDSFHSMKCTDPQYCPDCGGDGKKLMSASSVIFKGSGFYSTDYRDSGYLEAKKRDSGTPAPKPDTGTNSSSSDKSPTKKSDVPTPDKVPPPAKSGDTTKNEVAQAA